MCESLRNLNKYQVFQGLSLRYNVRLLGWFSMIRLFLFSFLFVAPSFAQKTFELRYQGKEGEVREYSFKTLYKARLTTLQDVHNLAEELEGRFSETILETGKDGVLRVQKEL